jgi:hypothetical protein
MKLKVFLLISCLLVFKCDLAIAAEECRGPDFTDEQIKEIIKRERFVTPKYPREYPSFEATIKKRGCYYIYIERMLPATPGGSLTFLVDQFGVIIDVRFGR